MPGTQPPAKSMQAQAHSATPWPCHTHPLLLQPVEDLRSQGFPLVILLEVLMVVYEGHPGASGQATRGATNTDPTPRLPAAKLVRLASHAEGEGKARRGRSLGKVRRVRYGRAAQRVRPARTRDLLLRQIKHSIRVLDPLRHVVRRSAAAVAGAALHAASHLPPSVGPARVGTQHTHPCLVSTRPL